MIGASDRFRYSNYFHYKNKRACRQPPVKVRTSNTGITDAAGMFRAFNP
jgi:hypothetical protein